MHLFFVLLKQFGDHSSKIVTIMILQERNSKLDDILIIFYISYVVKFPVGNWHV